MFPMKNNFLSAQILFSLAFPLFCFAHGDRLMHYGDFKGIFNGYGDPAFEELSYTISSGIDSYNYTLTNSMTGKTVEAQGLPGLFKARFGKVPANHRILGHGWSLNDNIPRKALDHLCNFYPGKEKEIIEVWNNFAKHLNNETIRITGLPQKQANAMASLLYDIHLLGDIEPDNKLIDLVLSPKSIVRNINKSSHTLFRPKYADLIQRRLT